MTKRVLNIGQCALDHSNISDLLNRHFSVEIDKAATHDEAISLATQNQYDLVLVNRIYDQDGSAGQQTIEQLCQSDSDCPVMLVSNYADAQQMAQAVGATKGFGKSQLNDSETIAALSAVLK